MIQPQKGVNYTLRRHALGSCSGDKIATFALVKMLRVHVSGICCSDMSQDVQLVELQGTRRGDKITPKLVLHNYKSISSHEGTCRRNISLKQAPATSSCVCTYCDFVSATCPRDTSLLHVASVCTIQEFCRGNMSLQLVPVTLKT